MTTYTKPGVYIMDYNTCHIDNTMAYFGDDVTDRIHRELKQNIEEMMIGTYATSHTTMTDFTTPRETATKGTAVETLCGMRNDSVTRQYIMDMLDRELNEMLRQQMTTTWDSARFYAPYIPQGIFDDKPSDSKLALHKDAEKYV